MSASSLQTLSQIVIAVGIVLGGLGGLGNYYFGKQAKIEEARETFQNSLHFHRLEAFWVEISPNLYQLGLAVTVLNKDATKVIVFNGVGYQGGFDLTGSMTIQSMGFYEGPVIVHGQYYLGPGGQEVIHILLPQEVGMTITAGVPQLTFTGDWTFIFENTPFPIETPNVVTTSVATISYWIRRSGGS